MISKNSSALDLLEYEKANAERYISIGWCVFVLVMNLAGNSIILLSTIRYRAIKLDRVSVLLIKNIAVSDILLAVFAVHPTLVSLIWDKWPYGTFLCSVFASLGNVCAISGILLVCTMHISKLLSLLYPLHSIGRTSRSGHVISISIWLLAAVSPITNITVDRHSFYFNYRTYRCCFSATAPVMKWLLPVSGFIFVIIPNLLVVCTTIALLSVVKKATGRVNRQGILTALYVGSVYLIAFLPVALYVTFNLNNGTYLTSMSPAAQRFFAVTVHKFVFNITLVNGISNIFIYYGSITSFRLFVRKSLYYHYQRLTLFPGSGRSESFEMS